MANIIGNLIFLKIGSNVVVGLTSKALNFDAEAQETTNQGSTGGFRTYISGYKGGNISVTGIYDEAATEGAVTAFTALKNGTTVTWKYGENGTAKTFWSGSALVTKLTINGNGSSPADYSFDLQITGVVTTASASF
jgi:predicted secreted protein